MASNDVIGALYYKVVLDPRGFARGAATVKSEQDLISRAIKSSVSDFDKLQAELDAIGDRSVKASEQERKILGDYQKQIISQMEGIADKEKELEKIAEENKRAEAEKEVLANLQKVLDKKKEAKKIAQDLADVQIAEEKRAAKEALKAEKQRIAEEKKLEKELAEYRDRKHGRRYTNITRYFRSWNGMKVLFGHIVDDVRNVNGGLSKMAGNLAQAAGMSPAMQGLARSLGAIGIPVLAFGAAMAATLKTVTYLIARVDEYQKQLIKMKSLLGGDIAATKQLMADMMSLAAATGFSTETMYGLAEALLNVGTSVMQVAQTGKLLAGLAGGDEQRLKFIAKAYGDVMMKGRLMGQEALQFANAGIPIYKALADMLNVSTAQVRVMMEEGKISAEQMAQALQKLGADRNIGGQLAANMKTVSGQLQRAKVLIDRIMLALAGNELNEFVANMIKSFNDLLEIVSKSSAFLKSLDESLGFVKNTLKGIVRLIPLIGEHLATFMDLSDLLNGTAGMTDEEKMHESLKEQAEAAKKQAEADRLAEERQQAEFEMAQKELKMRYESDAVRARSDYESWVMSQKLTDAQKEQLMNEYDKLERIKEEKELRRQMIEDDRRAAEEEVNRQAEFKRKAFSSANKAGASFGAGSVGEYGFLRDLILGRRENSEELKIMRSQEQALKNIETTAQDQLDALDNLAVGQELPPVVPVGGP